MSSFRIHSVGKYFIRQNKCRRKMTLKPLPWQDIFHYTPWQRGSMRPPWRFESKRRSASQHKPVDFSQRVSTNGGTFFTLGQYLTQLWQVKGQFSGKSTFFNFTRQKRCKLWQTSPWNIYHRVCLTIGSILMYNWLLLYGFCRCRAPGIPPGYVRRVASVADGRPLAISWAPCCLHCRKSEATVSKMNSRFEFRTSGNPCKHKHHMNLS